jgi:hypothetical protein
VQEFKCCFPNVETCYGVNKSRPLCHLKQIKNYPLVEGKIAEDGNERGEITQKDLCLLMISLD